MLKKLSIAGLALLASSGIAFADPSDPAADTNSMGEAASTTDASMNNAANGTATTTHKKHKRHHYKKHHRHHAAPMDPEPVAVAPMKGDYKGEVAAPCPTCPVPFHPGAYIGLSAGSLLNYVSGGSSYNGLQGTLFAGYGWMWDQWYAALEIFGQNNAQLTNYSALPGGSIRSTWGYGLSVLPGYTIVDNLLGFLRLGVIRTEFSSGNTWLTGGQVGLGMDLALCTNWDLRTEWDYSFYNSSGNVGSPKSQQYNIGLIYKFEM